MSVTVRNGCAKITVHNCRVVEEPHDWLDDDEMSRDETLRRFHELEPARMTKPPLRVRLRIARRAARDVVVALRGIPVVTRA